MPKPPALQVRHLGPLRLVTFAHGRGFITYPHITEHDPLLADLAEEALDHFVSQPQITQVEFKTRGHDYAPGLAQRLTALGFTAEDPESIMIGEMNSLFSDQPTPTGVQLRKISAETEVESMCRMVDQAFGEPYDPSTAKALSARLATNDGMELWVASIDGKMVGAGRLEPVAGTEFAGLWGGGVLPEYRGRGIYRALTDARARSPVANGYRYVHSDSTEYSRPILEAQGLIMVSTTTPYMWKRPSDQP